MASGCCKLEALDFFFPPFLRRHGSGGGREVGQEVGQKRERKKAVASHMHQAGNIDTIRQDNDDGTRRVGYKRGSAIVGMMMMGMRIILDAKDKSQKGVKQGP